MPPRRAPRKPEKGGKREPRQPILHEQTIYRGRGGRFVSSRQAKEILVEKESYQFRRTRSGKYAEAIRLTTKKTVLKMTERGLLDRPGRNQGQLDWALGSTNVTREKNARIIEVSIRSKTLRDKHRRFQGVMKVTEVFDSRMLTAFILDMLRQRGYRTQYDLQQIDWSKVKKPRITCPLCAGVGCVKCRKTGKILDPRRTKTAVGKRQQLKDVQITLRIRK